MIATLFALALAAPFDEPSLWRADFAAKSSFTTCEGCADARQVEGAALRLASAASLFGDLAVHVVLENAPREETKLVVGGDAGVAVRWRADGRVELVGQASAPALATDGAGTDFLLRVRSDACELFRDGAPCAFLALEPPIGGAPLRLEAAAGAGVALRALEVARLPFVDRDVVEGADAARLAALAKLPLEKFALKAGPVARLDPVYAIEVDGEAPLVVRARGVRRDEKQVPLLEQALAIAQIRPWLRVKVLDGDGKDGGVVAGQGEFGPYALSRNPGVIEIDSLCGILGAWPTLTLWDVTMDRVLDRVVPGGPAARTAGCEIPADCNRMRLTLTIPGQEPRVHLIDVQRPQ